MSIFCLATIYRQREISYKSVSDIPVCPRLAVKVWLICSWPYQFLCILLHLAVTLPRGFQYPCTQQHCRATLTCYYWYTLAGIRPEKLEGLIASRNSALPELNSLYVHMCAFMKVYAAVPAHTRWLWPLCQGQYQVKSTCKFIFIFPHYLPAYQSEAIKVVAGGFQPRMIPKLANQTLGWPQLTLRQKRRQINPYELFSTISQSILLHTQTFHYMVTFNSEQVVFFCNYMTKTL